MSPIQPNHLTDTEYYAVASSFNGYELERDNFLRWFEQAIVPHIHEHHGQSGCLRVLSVGAGPALFDLRLIAAIQRICGGLALDWTLVEPNPAQLDVAPCLDPDDRSGNAFLALLLGCAIERLEPTVLVRVRELVRMISVPGARGERVMHQPGGLLLFAREDAALPTARTAYPVPSQGLCARGG